MGKKGFSAAIGMLMCGFILYLSVFLSLELVAGQPQEKTDEPIGKAELRQKLRIFEPVIHMRDSMAVVLRKANNRRKADTMFVEYRKEAEKLVDTLWAQFDYDFRIVNILESPKQEDAQFFETEVEKYGLVFNYDMMQISISLSSDTLRRRFGKALSNEMREYLRILALMEQQQLLWDNCIMVEWNMVSDWIIALERLLDSSSDFILRNDVTSLYGWMRSAYLSGYGNSQVFDGGGLLPEVKKSYQRFLRTYPSSRTARLIREYVDILKKNKYRRCKAADALLGKSDITVQSD